MKGKKRKKIYKNLDETAQKREKKMKEKNENEREGREREIKTKILKKGKKSSTILPIKYLGTKYIYVKEKTLYATL